MELALFAADTNRPMKLKAIPYWDQSLDSEEPVGRLDGPLKTMLEWLVTVGLVMFLFLEGWHW